MNRFASIRHLRRFLHEETGATAIEYALIASGIAGAIVAVITTLGGSVLDMWTAVKNALG